MSRKVSKGSAHLTKMKRVLEGKGWKTWKQTSLRGNSSVIGLPLKTIYYRLQSIMAGERVCMSSNATLVDP